QAAPPNMDPVTEVYVGQSFNMRSTVSRQDASPMPTGYIYGHNDFFDGDVLLAGQNLLNNDTAQSTIPSPGLEPLPAGEYSIHSGFFPSLRGSRDLRPSLPGSSSGFEILSPAEP